jgi:hypothetical protein
MKLKNLLCMFGIVAILLSGCGTDEIQKEAANSKMSESPLEPASKKPNSQENIESNQSAAADKSPQQTESQVPLRPLTYEEKIIGQFASVIAAFKSGDKRKMAETISYPLELPKPLPPIISTEDMLERFDLVFDQEMIDKIAHSTLSDWDLMGWRGVMFENGQVWAEESGKLFRVRANTSAMQAAIAAAYQEEKKKLHASIADYNKPVLSWNSKRFNVRIDDMGDAGYRYAVWPGNKFQNDKPDLVLEGGTVRHEGSGNYAHYTFKNGHYQYHVSEGGEGMSIGSLNVFKGETRLVTVKFENEGPKFRQLFPMIKLTNRIEMAHEITRRLAQKEAFGDLDTGPIKFEYERYYRGNGTTYGVLPSLPLSHLNDEIRLKISIDNQGWGYDKDRDPVPKVSHQKMAFSLDKEIAQWDRFEVANDYNCDSPCKISQTDNPIYIYGGGASEGIALYFESVDGIDRLVGFTYLSEDPG